MHCTLCCYTSVPVSYETFYQILFLYLQSFIYASSLYHTPMHVLLCLTPHSYLKLLPHFLLVAGECVGPCEPSG